MYQLIVMIRVYDFGGREGGRSRRRRNIYSVREVYIQKKCMFGGYCVEGKRYRGVNMIIH